jgi:hypothetical protein
MKRRWAKTVVLASSMVLMASCHDPAGRAMPSPNGEASAELRAAEIGPDASPGVTPVAPPPPEDWIERLDLPEGGLAYVTPPRGASEPRPVVVAIHGAIDDAGLICSAWRLITDVYPFVLCPAGSKVRKDTYVWPSSEAIDKTIDRALVALHARFGDRVAGGPAIYVGFSQGANLAGPVLGARKAEPRFARAVLTEGGYRGIDGASARAFVKGGGRRVLFTCSQPGCASWFGASRAALASAGGESQLTYSGSYGHSMLPAVRESIHQALPWVVEGLEGWNAYATAPRLPIH